MKVVARICSLALGPLASVACKAAGLESAVDGVQAVAGFLVERFTDHSERLPEALEKANRRAWLTLELALAGPSWGERVGRLLARAEDRALAGQVRAFLDAHPLPVLPGEAAFRQQCLQELRAARKAGILDQGALSAAELAEQAGHLARFTDPQGLLEVERQTLEGLAGDLRQAGYAQLASLLALRPPQGPPLLAAAARYFFRREVENDEQLFRGLAFAQLEQLTQSQESGFQALGEAFTRQGDRLEQLLGDVQAVVEQTHEAVLDLQAELRGQREQVQELGRAVLQLLEQHQLQQRPLRPSDSLSVRGEGDRRRVRQLADSCRGLAPDERRQLPALLNALGKLEVAAGEYGGARQDFQAAAALLSAPQARAEVHYNAYRAALEQRDWNAALVELKAALEGDAERFAPFPLDKFRPERILGAGGFGVVFLCRHLHMGSPVVVKALLQDEMDRDVSLLFAEARALAGLNHPAVIKVQDCSYVDPARRGRPYLVMDYFDGPSLEDYVAKHGTLSLREVLTLARTMAEALRAAHAKGVLHRDVKPANVLVRREGAGLQVKLIDFGLALRSETLQQTVGGSGGRSVLGGSIAGTLDYAAPEQMGKLPGATAGPYSDVYGFSRTCCFALFQTPRPLTRHWRDASEGLAELMEACQEERPECRPQNFDAVLTTLARLDARKPAPAVPAAPSLPAAPRKLVPVRAEATPTALPAYDRPVPREVPRRRVPVPAETYPDVLPVVEHRPHRPAPPRPQAKPRRRSWWRIGMGVAVVGAVGLIVVGAAWQALNWVRGRLSTPSPAYTGFPTAPGFPAMPTPSFPAMPAPPGFPGFPTHAPTLPLPEGPPPKQTILAADPQTGRPTGVWSVAYSQDGKNLLTGDGNFFGSHARLWDAKSGLRLSELMTQRPEFLGVAFQPGGRLVALAGNSTGTHLIDLDHPASVRTFAQEGAVRGVAFSPDGKQIATESDKLLQVWDVASGDRVAQAVVKIAPFWGATSVSLAYSPDDSVLAFPDGATGVALLDAKTGALKTTLTGHQGNVFCVAFTADSQTMASGGADKIVILWDAKARGERKRLTGARDAVTSVAFTPDGKKLAAGCKDGGVLVWDVDREQALATMGMKGPTAVTFSPDGKTLAAASGDGAVRLWDAAALIDVGDKSKEGEKKSP